MGMEEILEGRFKKWCNSVGAMHVKGPTADSKGFADQITILPHGGGTIYAEFKFSMSYDLTPTQLWWRNIYILSNPYRYFAVKSYEDLDECIKACEIFIEQGYKSIKCEAELFKEAGFLINPYKSIPLVYSQKFDTFRYFTNVNYALGTSVSVREIAETDIVCVVIKSVFDKQLNGYVIDVEPVKALIYKQ